LGTRGCPLSPRALFGGSESEGRAVKRSLSGEVTTFTLARRLTRKLPGEAEFVGVGFVGCDRESAMKIVLLTCVFAMGFYFGLQAEEESELREVVEAVVGLVADQAEAW